MSCRATLTWLLLLDIATIVAPLVPLPQSELWVTNTFALAPVPLQIVSIVLISLCLRRNAPSSRLRSVLWWHRPVSIVVALFFSLGIVVVLFPKGGWVPSR